MCSVSNRFSYFPFVQNYRHDYSTTVVHLAITVHIYRYGTKMTYTQVMAPDILQTDDLTVILKRLKGNKSLQAWADDLGVAKSTVALWMGGGAIPRAEVLRQLGISVTYSIHVVRKNGR